MIPKTRVPVQTIPLRVDEEFSWQQLLAGASLSLPELYERLGLSLTANEEQLSAAQSFAIRAPAPYLDRIEPGNAEDPLLLQILPQAREMQAVSGYHLDPLEESDSNPLPGLVHKYQSRVLLILSGACAINCRYCFRRHFPYSDNQLGKQQWQQILTYLQQNPKVNEVIFSGGDPLATPDQRLQKLLDDLAEIPHISRIRIHTRLPIVIPQRITDELLSTLTSTRLDCLMVIHANHPNEIDEAVSQQLLRVKSAGVTLLNQSVLLKGINDDAATLAALSEKLFSAGCLPYYLHLLDPVAGAAHFDCDEREGKNLIKAMQAQLPGYLVPKLVREVPDRPSKTLI